MKNLATKLVAGTCIAFALTQSAVAEKVYKLKLAQTWPTNFPIFADAVSNMADMAEKMSNGRLKIRIDSSNKHKSPFGVFDMVKAGQYDMGHSASYYWKGKDVNTLLFTTMPFGMIASEQYAWFYHGGGMELMKKAYDRHKVYSFPGGNTGNQMGGWFRKEIKSVEDLKGLKMRIPGFAGEVVSRVGVSAVNIAPGELYTALDRGTIDALEWVGPAMDIKMGFHKIAKYYYSGWHEPATELQFLVNKRKFNKLPSDLQEILTVSMKLAAYDMYTQSMHENAIAWETIKTEFPDIKVAPFPKDIVAKLRVENDKLLDEKAAEQDKKGNKLFSEVLESQREYLKKIRTWTNMSDYSYLKDVVK